MYRYSHNVGIWRNDELISYYVILFFLFLRA